MELFEILQIVFWTILVTCLFRMSRFNMYEARTFWGGTQFRPSPRSKGSSCWTSSADVLDSNEVPECPCPMIRDLGSINFSLQNPHRNTKFWHVCGSRFQRPKKHHQKPKKTSCCSVTRYSFQDLRFEPHKPKSVSYRLHNQGSYDLIIATPMIFP